MASDFREQGQGENDNRRESDPRTVVAQGWIFQHWSSAESVADIDVVVREDREFADRRRQNRHCQNARENHGLIRRAVTRDRKRRVVTGRQKWRDRSNRHEQDSADNRCCCEQCCWIESFDERLLALVGEYPQPRGRHQDQTEKGVIGARPSSKNHQDCNGCNFFGREAVKAPGADQLSENYRSDSAVNCGEVGVTKAATKVKRNERECRRQRDCKWSPQPGQANGKVGEYRNEWVAQNKQQVDSQVRVTGKSADYRGKNILGDVKGGENSKVHAKRVPVVIPAGEAEPPPVVYIDIGAEHVSVSPGVAQVAEGRRQCHQGNEKSDDSCNADFDHRSISQGIAHQCESTLPTWVNLILAGLNYTRGTQEHTAPVVGCFELNSGVSESLTELAGQHGWGHVVVVPVEFCECQAVRNHQVLKFKRIVELGQDFVVGRSLMVVLSLGWLVHCKPWLKLGLDRVFNLRADRG